MQIRLAIHTNVCRSFRYYLKADQICGCKGRQAKWKGSEGGGCVGGEREREKGRVQKREEEKKHET